MCSGGNWDSGKLVPCPASESSKNDGEWLLQNGSASGRSWARFPGSCLREGSKCKVTFSSARFLSPCGKGHLDVQKGCSLRPRNVGDPVMSRLPPCSSCRQPRQCMQCAGHGCGVSAEHVWKLSYWRPQREDKNGSPKRSRWAGVDGVTEHAWFLQGLGTDSGLQVGYPAKDGRPLGVASSPLWHGPCSSALL